MVDFHLDVKKDRRNNLVPAKVGIYTIFVFILFLFLDSIAYSMTDVNVEKRVFFIAFANDVIYSIAAPAMALYAMPGVLKTFRNRFT